MKLSLLLKEMNGSVKIETDINKIQSIYAKYKDNMTICRKTSDKQIVGIAYDSVNEKDRLESLIQALTKKFGYRPTGSRRYEFLSYKDGMEDWFKL